jgi:hypothetical protein
MTVKLLRINDNEIITKENVKEITSNYYGNIRLIFKNDKKLTLQNAMFKVINN